MSERFWKRHEAEIKALYEHHRYRAKGPAEERAVQEHGEFARLVQAMLNELVSLDARVNGLSIEFAQYCEKRAAYDAERQGGAR